MRTLSIIFVFLSNLAFSQDKELSADSDSTFWYRWRSVLIREIGINTIDSSTEKFEFRFWDGYKVVRLWDSGSGLKSEVIYFLREYRENKNSHDRNGRLYYSNLQLDQKTTKAIKHLITDFNIQNIPSDNQIAGWGQGFDGITYIVESSNPDTFSFKTYWTPTTFPEIPEARFFQYFVEQINSLEEIKSGFDKFMAKQPFKSYFDGIGSARIATVVR